MRKRFVLYFILTNALAVGQQKNNLPTAQTYSKHGVTITDEYYWLEKPTTTAAQDWLKDIHLKSDEIVKKASEKYRFEEKINAYNNCLVRSIPKKKGDYFFSVSYKNETSLPVVMYRKKIDDEGTILFDLNDHFKNKNILLSSLVPSYNSNYVAYKISTDGSDLNEIHFYNLAKKQKLEDVITDVKFSNLAWNLDKGIFYKKNNNTQKTAVDSTNQLYYHTIGTHPREDRLVFDTSKSGNSFSYFTKRDQLIIIETDPTETYHNFYATSLADQELYLYKFLENDSTGMKFLHYSRDSIYYSSKMFEWGEVRAFHKNNRTREKVIIPQIYGQLLTETHFDKKYIFCLYKTPSKNILRVYDRAGTFVRKFDSMENFEFTYNFYDSDTNHLYLQTHSYTVPPRNFRLNIENGEIIEYYNNYIKAKALPFPTNYFETKNLTFKSRDQKEIPITILYKKGLVLDGNNPTLLSAYGGFGVVSSATYSSGLVHFLDLGGVYAFAQIRGGGEKGYKWHESGKGLEKMNSFSDFIDAAEFLIEEKYTNPKKLAITGSSNGGLVVGVALTQRPDLFQVAISQMGAFDMIKFDQFTVGKYHLDEYGNTEVREEFEALLKYSPYHNVQDSINYPTTILITSENDDRVPPLHSYKFAAKLLNREAQKNPVFVITHSNSGHYGKTATYQDDLNNEALLYNLTLYFLKD